MIHKDPTFPHKKCTFVNKSSQLVNKSWFAFTKLTTYKTLICTDRFTAFGWNFNIHISSWILIYVHLGYHVKIEICYWVRRSCMIQRKKQQICYFWRVDIHKHVLTFFWHFFKASHVVPTKHNVYYMYIVHYYYFHTMILDYASVSVHNKKKHRKLTRMQHSFSLWICILWQWLKQGDITSYCLPCQFLPLAHHSLYEGSWEGENGTIQNSIFNAINYGSKLVFCVCNQ